MKNKKIIQIGAITAIALISLYLISLLSSTTRGFVNVETSVAMTQLKKNNVTEANIDDREQRLRLKLKQGIEHDGKQNVTEIMTQYPARTSPDIFKKVEASKTDKIHHQCHPRQHPRADVELYPAHAHCLWADFMVL